MPKPRSGKPRAPSNPSKASKQKKLGKGKKSSAAGSGEAGGRGEGARKSRSFWGLVGTLAGFTAVFAWSVWARSTQGKQKREDDQRLLAGMRRKPLRYTEHASCRLDCRRVSRDEVAQAMLQGSINSRKSEPKLRPCPKYVVDAAVDVGGAGGGRAQRKNIQAVFAACADETRVLTVIDQDTDWPCPPC